MKKEETGPRGTRRRPPRVVVLGEDDPSLRCAAILGEARLADIVLAAESPAGTQRAAQALAARGGMARVSLMLEDAAPCDLVIMFSSDAARVRDIALWAARTCPHTVLVIASPDGLGLSRQAARASGLLPGLILSPGGMPRARAEADRLSVRLDVARVQVSVPVLGGDEAASRLPVRRHANVAGIPARELDPAGWRAWCEDPEPSLDGDSLVPSAVELARAVIQDTSGIHSCGAWVSGDAGLPGGFVVMPVRVGAKGAGGALPLNLTMDERARLQRHAVPL